MFSAHLNKRLRGLASILSPGNPLRRLLSRVWDDILRLSGRPVSVQIHGEWVSLSPQFRSIAADYEAETLPLYLQLIQKGSQVWDVGANLGLYTILGARRVGTTGKVVCWEAAPQTCDILRGHIAANKMMDRCVVRNEAMADGATLEVHFTVSDAAADPMNRVLVGANANRNSVRIPATSLDASAESMGAPDLVKIDVEGFECPVMEGAHRLLEGGFGKRPVVILAVHPQMVKDFQTKDGPRMMQILAGARYRSFTMEGKPAVLDNYQEYLILPEEKIASVFATLGFPNSKAA